MKRVVISMISVILLITTAQAALGIYRRQAQGGLALGKLMQGPDQVFRAGQSTWIKIKVNRPALSTLLEIYRVVQGIMTVYAANHAIGMDIERVVQFLLAGDVQTTVQQLLW